MFPSRDIPIWIATGVLGGSVSLPWYLKTTGLSQSAITAVYQPYGATSLATSYINLINPGTNDAAPGTAPSFDTTKGWTFAAASSQYLTTGLKVNSNSSIVIRFANSVANTGYVFGLLDISPTRRFSIRPYTSGTVRYERGDSNISIAPQVQTGVLGITGGVAYRNGIAEGTPLPAWTGGETSLALLLGCINSAGTPGTFYSGDILAVFYCKDTVLTPAQMLEVSTNINF